MDVHDDASQKWMIDQHQELQQDDEQEAVANRVPEEINQLVIDFQSAYVQFVLGLDSYIYKKKRKASEVETVQLVIDCFPELLSAKDSRGNLPIHIAVEEKESSSSIYIPLLAKAGYNDESHCGLSGRDRRGGLLVKGQSPMLPLQTIAMNGDIRIMHELQNANPPLFDKSDINDHLLVHGSVYHGNLQMVKWLLDIDPSILYNDECGSLPIHFANTFEMSTLLLKTAIEYNPHHNSIGGLFAKNDEGLLTINYMVMTHGSEKTWHWIEQTLCKYDTLPILHRAVQYTPMHVNNFITSFPHSCFLRDETNRLPIHYALEHGMKWSAVLVSMMNANYQHLCDNDPVTELSPSALAASSPCCDLRTINYLLRMFPRHLEEM